jgi:ubiquinone/menaquinone biosynthesis C-methylase UbiE
MSQTQAFLDRVIATFGAASDDRAYRDEQWPMRVQGADAIVERLGARPPARILDLACGTGAEATALALRGFEVTGIDCTPARIDIARRKAAEKGAAAQWLCQDMREIDYHEVLDYVMLRDVIFGIFEREQENVDLLRRMARALKPHGRCLLEVYDKEFAMPRGVEGSHFYDASTDRFVAKTPGPGINSIKLYTREQWESMLGEQGLKVMTMDGWSSAKDPAPPPWRIDIMVAQRVG